MSENTETIDRYVTTGHAGVSLEKHMVVMVKIMKCCVSFVEASMVFTAYLQFDLHALLLLVVGFMLVNLLCCCWGTGFGRV